MAFTKTRPNGHADATVSPTWATSVKSVILLILVFCITACGRKPTTTENQKDRGKDAISFSGEAHVDSVAHPLPPIELRVLWQKKESSAYTAGLLIQNNTLDALAVSGWKNAQGLFVPVCELQIVGDQSGAWSRFDTGSTAAELRKIAPFSKMEFLAEFDQRRIEALHIKRNTLVYMRCGEKILSDVFELL